MPAAAARSFLRPQRPALPALFQPVPDLADLYRPHLLGSITRASAQPLAQIVSSPVWFVVVQPLVRATCCPSASSTACGPAAPGDGSSAASQISARFSGVIRSIAGAFPCRPSGIPSSGRFRLRGEGLR